MTELRWEAPGPGQWYLNREHVPKPVPRLEFEFLDRGATGWAESAERYGTSAGAPRWGWVNGWTYYGPTPVDAEDLARREVAAAETLASKRWREDVRRWHEEIRPRIEATNRGLQEEDPVVMDDDALADHLGRAIDNVWSAVPVHFALNTTFAIGGGAAFEALYARGLSRPDIISRLGGGSPGSARARALIDAIVEEVGDRAITSIDHLRGPALDVYLGEFGCRAVGGERATLLERPDIVVASVRARRAGAGGTMQPSSTDDPVIDELRALYGLNDDNGGITGNWPIGLVRRAALEVARRIGVHDPEDVFETTADELRCLLSGAGPAPDELRARAGRRELAAEADPPRMLVGDGEMPTAPTELPTSVARIEALSAALWASAEPSGEPLHGLGVGTEVYRGRACVIEGAGALDLEPGDVIVARVTHSSHNTVFPIAGAELGGLLSHPAVLARELGLPAVVGVRGLLDRVKTGDIVEVDPVAGVLRVIQG